MAGELSWVGVAGLFEHSSESAGDGINRAAQWPAKIGRRFVARGVGLP